MIYQGTFPFGYFIRIGTATEIYFPFRVTNPGIACRSGEM